MEKEYKKQVKNSFLQLVENPYHDEITIIQIIQQRVKLEWLDNFEEVAYFFITEKGARKEDIETEVITYSVPFGSSYTILLNFGRYSVPGIGTKYVVTSSENIGLQNQQFYENIKNKHLVCIKLYEHGNLQVFKEVDTSKGDPTTLPWRRKVFTKKAFEKTWVQTSFNPFEKQQKKFDAFNTEYEEWVANWKETHGFKTDLFMYDKRYIEAHDKKLLELLKKYNLTDSDIDFQSFI